MTTSLPTLIGPCLLALAAALPAQTLHVRGELDEGRSTGCYYCPNVPYTVKFSETPVRSSTVDLQFYKNLSAQLILHGTWDTSVNPAGLNVSSVEIVSESLGVSNTARTGTSLRFTVSGPAAAPAGVIIAQGAGFLQLFQSALLLDPASLLVLGAGALGAQGSWRFELPIPADPQLIGFRFWSQALIVPPNDVPYWSNPQRTLIDR
ncbi:MAG: hypothetical protein R3F56_13660 [Planctomycetota bacterium]